MGPSLEAHIRYIVADRLGVDPDDLTADVSLADDLAADSLDLMDVAVAVERECDVALPDTVLGGVRSFDGLIADALAITYAEPRVAPEDLNKLWTI